MEIKPVIFCTTDETTDSIIKTVFELLPTEIRLFHQQISSVQLYSNEMSQIFSETIDRTLRLKDTDIFKRRHLTTGQFECDFFIINHRKAQNEIDKVSDTFKTVFAEKKTNGNYEEIWFSLTDGRIRSKHDIYYLSNVNSQGSMISNEELFEKVKYFFLLFLTSELYESDKLDLTNRSFYFEANPAQKYFKSFALEYEGVPLFELRELYELQLKEYYVSNLLDDSDEQNSGSVLNKIQVISSLVVEELKIPEKPENDLKISFFSTKKNRNNIIQQALDLAKINFDKHQILCHKEAKTQRVAYETSLKTKLPEKINDLISEIVAGSQSISKLRRLLLKLLDKSCNLYSLIRDKENEVKWSNQFRFFSRDFSSNHPNWIVMSILAGVFLLPEFIDYIFYFPTESMIKWNIIVGVIWVCYVLYSIFNLKRVMKSFNDYYIRNLQGTEKFYRTSFKSFIKYLEIYILRYIVRRLETTDRILINNQAFLAAYYLFSFSGAQNYDNIKKMIITEMKIKTSSNFWFADQLKKQLVKIIPVTEVTKEKIKSIVEIKDTYECCVKLIDLIEEISNGSRLLTLRNHLSKIINGNKVLEIIDSKLNTFRKNFDTAGFLKPINLTSLESELNNFVADNNFNNLLVSIKQRLSYDVKESLKKLVAKPDMFYLSSSQDRIDDPKEIIFTPDILNLTEIPEYKNHLHILCGYLKIFELKFDQEQETKNEVSS